jgi:hypothetical protein
MDGWMNEYIQTNQPNNKSISDDLKTLVFLILKVLCRSAFCALVRFRASFTRDISKRKHSYYILWLSSKVEIDSPGKSPGCGYQKLVWIYDMHYVEYI